MGGHNAGIANLKHLKKKNTIRKMGGKCVDTWPQIQVLQNTSPYELWLGFKYLNV